MEIDSAWRVYWWILWILIYTFIAFCLIAASRWIRWIFFPAIVKYPWALAESPKQRECEQKQTVAFAGSFNPPHLGHLAMLEYLSTRYGRVILVVGMNPNKQYLVTPYQRAELLRKMVYEQLPASQNILIKVVQGYIWRKVKPMGASVFVRGIRSWEKDGADERQLQILNTWGPLLLGPLWWPLPTVFLEGKPEYSHVSSTLIRNFCRQGKAGAGTLAALVPESIAQEVAALYGKEI